MVYRLCSVNLSYKNYKLAPITSNGSSKLLEFSENLEQAILSEVSNEKRATTIPKGSTPK
jgi:hypothetical protein